MKINIPIIKLLNQVPTEIYQAHIVLEDDHIVYFHNFDAEECKNEEDDKLGKHNVLNYLDAFAFKRHIVGTEMVNILVPEGTWRLLIIVAGMSNDIRIFFDDKKKCLDMKKVIDAWLITGEIPTK